MTAAALPPNEVSRRAALHRLEVLDSEPEAEFDAIVHAASLVCGVPISLISLVDTDRQWFKANHGFDGTLQTPRDQAFCAHAILGDALFEVVDAPRDARFADNPLVTSASGIRFYAGAPLVMADGHRVGTLCVIDHQPRQLQPGQRELLTELAQAAAKALEGRRARLAERRLLLAQEQANAFLLEVLALGPDGLAAVDSLQRISYCNERFLHLAALPAAGCAGWPLSEVWEHLQSQCAAGAPVAPTVAGQVKTLVLQRPQHRVLEISLHAGHGGPASAALLHLHDVTEPFDLDKTKSTFIAAAAHELRTPMASIFGYSELLLSRELPAERQRAMMEKIHRHAQTMMDLTGQLLDMATLEAQGSDALKLQPLRIAPEVQHAVDGFRPPAGRDGPVLTITAPDACAPADAAKLQQVLANLLSNAYKYSPAGGPVHVRLLDEPTALQLEVQDHGIGLSAEHRGRVTEKFFRADRSGQIPGTGLGMSIVQQIVSLMGGQLHIHSQPGQGTCVAVVLPKLAQPAASA